MERSQSLLIPSSSRDPGASWQAPYRDDNDEDEDTRSSPLSPQSPFSLSSFRQISFTNLTLSSPSKTDSPITQIALEDHTEGDFEESSSLWAKAVTIDDYTIVGGSAVGGSYVVWNCTVETLEGGSMKIRKRYSEFNALRRDLIKTFPHACEALPQLPRKSVVSRFRPRFLEMRRNGLTYFLNCVLLNPEFAGSPVLKDFLFS